MAINLASDAAPRAIAGGARPWYKLSLPGTASYEAFPKPALDPLLCWPDQYEPEIDTLRWSRALRWDAGLRDSRHALHGIYNHSTLVDTGFEQYTVNYAFNYLYDAIPSGAKGKTLIFDVNSEKDVEIKMRNFYSLLKVRQ